MNSLKGFEGLKTIFNFHILNPSWKAVQFYLIYFIWFSWYTICINYDFSTLYTTLAHDKLLKRLWNIIDFIFEGGNRAHICISKNNVAYCGKKFKDNIAFSKSPWNTFLKHLIQNCYFMVGNSLLRQKVGIPVGTDPAPFWLNLFSHTYENEYLPELISNDKKHAVFKQLNVLLMISVP